MTRYERRIAASPHRLIASSLNGQAEMADSETLSKVLARLSSDRSTVLMGRILLRIRKRPRFPAA